MQKNGESNGQIELLSEGWRSVSLFSDSLRFPISVDRLRSASLFPSRSCRFVLSKRTIARYCSRLSCLEQRPIDFVSHENFCPAATHHPKEAFRISTRFDCRNGLTLFDESSLWSLKSCHFIWTKISLIPKMNFYQF